MISNITEVSSRISEIYDRIEEIQGYSSLGAINAIDSTTADETETTDSELTFSEILSQVMDDDNLSSSSLLGDYSLGQLGSVIDETEDSSYLDSLYSSLSLTDSDTDDVTSIISSASELYGVDESLIKAVIQQESSYIPTAVSPAGAMGLMQLMPQTAELLGVEDAFDVSENVYGGTKYLSRLMEYYDNNVVKSLAAYNAGTAAVDSAGGVPNYPETQNYVLKVLQYYEEYKGLE